MIGQLGLSQIRQTHIFLPVDVFRPGRHMFAEFIVDGLVQTAEIDVGFFHVLGDGVASQLAADRQRFDLPVDAEFRPLLSSLMAPLSASLALSYTPTDTNPALFAERMAWITSSKTNISSGPSPILCAACR